MYNSSPKNNAQYEIDTKQEGVLLFKAKKDIQKGEEITVNYGKEWFEGRGLIHQK
jgi:SET domain-containing protein